MTTNYEGDGVTELTLTINGRTTTWRAEADDCTFEEVLDGFLGCMFGQTYVPGTEMRVFEKYMKGMENIYNNSLNK